MLDFLKRLLRHPDRQAKSLPYRIYTTDYDLEIRGDQLSDALGSPSEEDRIEWESQWLKLGQHLDAADPASAKPAMGHLSDRLLRQLAVGFLLDHSGSMKGEKILHTAAAAERVALLLMELNVPFELLGFTTQGWHGGRSRKSWLKRRRPRRPGRLCDLLHLIYRTADDTVPFDRSILKPMLRPDLLRENIDGEAIEWAVKRMKAIPRDTKALFVISDGMPADDATLLHNDPEILSRDLQRVIAEVEKSGILLVGIVLGRQPSPYKAHVVVEKPEDLEAFAIKALVQTIVAQASKV